ncbi:MAG TPA: energy transducer TonB [Candidatus Eisenbacteria bacterium]
MEFKDKPSRLRRGAAPPDERASLFFLAVASALHAAILLFFVSWVKAPIDVALPGSSGPSVPRMRLVHLSPLRTFPSAEAAAPEAVQARPKPALIKRYTPGARIEVKPERGPARKSANDESKTASREVAPAPQADLMPRWWSPDSSRAVGVRTEGDFRFAYYLAAIRNKIGSRWVPPPGIDARGRVVHATLYFRIGRDGQISVAQIENSSGNPFFDQTAMRALLAATPLPPLPAGYDNDWLGVHFGFDYQQ